MEKINYRFLNYKRYSKFLADLQDGKVREDAIVFIQDNLHPCIWARGKEYVCEGPYTSTIDDTNGLILKNGSDKVLLQILPSEDSIRLLDSRGVILTYEFASANSFNTFVYNINKTIQDLSKDKADKKDLDKYVLKSVYIPEMAGKQGKLTAGFGIDIDGDNRIKVIVDNELYEIVTDLPNAPEALKNKIYVLETPLGNNTYKYIQYVVKNNQWVSIGELSSNVDLRDYLKKSEARSLYQPIGEYLTSVDLDDYALEEDLLELLNSLDDYVTLDYLLSTYQPKGNYAYAQWVEDTFVKKVDVYTPENGFSGEGSGNPGTSTSNPYNNIIVDTKLSFSSKNPVQNKVITLALFDKADKSELSLYIKKDELPVSPSTDLSILSEYETKAEHALDLETKLNLLIPGKGIHIIDDEIKTNLAEVAYSGRYNDLIGAPALITVDSTLSSTSTNPVQNSAIYAELNNKVNTSVLSNYELAEDHSADMRTKQDKLTAGTGIKILNNVISTDIDTELYLIVTSLPDASDADESKIYILELPNGQGGYTYTQHRVKNGQWVTIGNVAPNINLTPYLKSEDAEALYQPKRNDYVIQSDLLTLTPLSRTTALEESLNNYVLFEYLIQNYQPKADYALKSWAEDMFVKKVDVYTPNQQDIIQGGTGGTYTPSGGGSSYTITIDSTLSATSYNPVRNSTIYAALLNKQDVLVAGDGISIEGNVISSTLDTNVFVIVSSLESVSTPNENKIYLLETVENGETVYIEYRWRNNTWVEIGRKDIDIDLTDYAKLSDLAGFASSTDLLDYTLIQDFEDYKTWAENTYAKSQIVIQPSTPTITVDTELNINSANPVENRVVTANLNLKANKSELQNYVTKEELNSKVDNMDLTAYVTNETYTLGLAGKQDTLTPGRGISIVNNTISSTLDTDVFVIVNSLPTLGNPNKIYLVETTQNDEVIYIEWRYVEGEWVEIGQKDPGIDLTPYLTKTEAASTYITEATADGKYQLKGDYMTRTEALTQHNTLSNAIDDLFEELEDYATDAQLESLRLYISLIYQRKGDYVLAEDVSTALTVLQQIIDQKYVLKKDVYNPNGMGGWSTEDPTTISVGGSTGGNTSGGVGVQSNMVTLTTQQYQSLVDNNLIDEATYYFTYEGEEETINNWTFGGTFPITFHDGGIGTFPITLT